MEYAILTLGSGALRTALEMTGDFPGGTKFFHVDTSNRDVERDGKRRGFSVVDGDGNEKKISGNFSDISYLKKGDEVIEIHITGEDGEGGGMDPNYVRGLLSKEIIDSESESGLMDKLKFLRNTRIAMFFAFAGNGTGTNLPFLLKELVSLYPRTVFLPVVGLPLRAHVTALNKAVKVTLEEMKSEKLPKPIIVDNNSYNFKTIADLNKINEELAKAFKSLMEIGEKADTFPWDTRDMRNAVGVPDWTLLGHTKLTNGKLMDGFSKLVSFEQQFAVPNKAGTAICGVKAWGNREDEEISDHYKRVSEWVCKHCEDNKTALWTVKDGRTFEPEATLLMSGLPYEAIRPDLQVG